MRCPSAQTIVPLWLSLVVAVVASVQFDGGALGQDAGTDSGPVPLTTQPLGMTGWRRDMIRVTTPVLGFAGWRPDPIIDITTPTLGMTGWQPSLIVTITTASLGMTGWQREPVTIATETLAMSGWQRDPVAVRTKTLGMSGWARAPVIVTTGAFAMSGWASIPEQCSPPFLYNAAEEKCVCPSDLLPFGRTCIVARTSPPADLRVVMEGPESCEKGQMCPFDVIVTNIGPGSFRGPLVVVDEVSLEEVQLSGADWSCAAGACVHPEVTLAPGASEVLRLDGRVPAGIRRGSKLEPCATLEAPEPGDAPVQFVQLMLAAAGIDAGRADNQMGPKTRNAIDSFRRAVELPRGFDIDEPLIAALKDLMPVDPRPENDRGCSETSVVN